MTQATAILCPQHAGIPNRNLDFWKLDVVACESGFAEAMAHKRINFVFSGDPKIPFSEGCLEVPS